MRKYLLGAPPPWSNDDLLKAAKSTEHTDGKSRKTIVELIASNADADTAHLHLRITAAGSSMRRMRIVGKSVFSSSVSRKVHRRPIMQAAAIGPIGLKLAIMLTFSCVSSYSSGQSMRNARPKSASICA